MSVRDEQLLRPVWPFALNHNSVQAQGLYAWYPMAFPGGSSLFDMSGNNRHISLTGTTWDACNFGTGVALNIPGTASTQFGLVNSNVSLPMPLTVTAWFYTAVTAGVQTIVSVPNANAMYRLILYQTKVQSQSQSGGLAATSTTYSTNQWQHAAGVFESSTLRAAYLNASGKGTNTTSGTGGGTASAYSLGWWQTANYEPMNGKLADIRIYNRALSDAEVRSLYDPDTRYELYYPLGRRLWFIPATVTVNQLSVSGSITPAGALVKQDIKAASGSITPSGTATKQANKSASGSVAPSGSVVRSFASALAGAITPSGALAKVFSSTMSGSITPSGTLDALRTALLSLAGSLGLSGALARRADKGLSGSVTPAGGLAKRIGKLLSGAIAAAGALVTSLTTTNQKITCTLSDEAVTVASVSDELGG